MEEVNITYESIVGRGLMNREIEDRPGIFKGQSLPFIGLNLHKYSNSLYIYHCGGNWPF